MSLHIAIVPPRTLCESDGDFIDMKFIVKHVWKVRVLMFLFGCRDCGAELRRVMATARPIR